MARRRPPAMLLWCASLCSFQLAAGLFRPQDPDVGKRMPELVSSNGYPIETHYVTTEDGYVLTAFRIPHGRNRFAHLKINGTGRPVVLLQHALLDSSFAFVSTGPGRALGYILADAGFDVWFGNNRGNMYSINHTKWGTESSQFWDFTWDDMARYDLPAEIEYVLHTTGAKKLAYIGHSQGSIQAFAGFSRNRTLAEKVNIFVALAPVVYNRNIGGLWGNIGRHLGLMRLLLWLGMKKFMTPGGIINRIAPTVYHAFPLLTSSIINLICGPTQHLDIERGPVIVSNTPAGTSMKNMVHWEQVASADTFRMFDYGSAEENFARYRSESPPEYQLQDLAVPVALFTGGNDPLAHPEDVRRLLSEVPGDVLITVEHLPTYAHVDFTWARDARELLYPRVLSALASYTK